MAFINGKKILTIIKGGGGSTGGDIAINTLNGTTWKLKDPFNTDEAQFAYNINFISNNENFICLLYAPNTGLLYIGENENIVTVYDETTNTWNANEAYRTFKITGGDHVTNTHAIEDLKYIATLIAVEGGGGEPVNGTIEITENGTHDVSKYASANVNVASSGGSGKQFTAKLVSSKVGIKATITAIMNKKQFTASMTQVIE